MRKFINFIREKTKNFFRVRHQSSREDINLLFKNKYNKFKRLINANNNALRTMAELEQTFYGDKSYGIVFIRTKITSIIVNVYKMVNNLIEMSDGKYNTLQEKLDEIKDKIISVYERKIPVPKGNWCISMDNHDVENSSLVGEKMANIGKIKRNLNLNISPFFVITSSAYNYFIISNDLQNEINKFLNNLNSENIDEVIKCSNNIKNLILNSYIPDDLKTSIYKQYKKLESLTKENVLVSLRSSATSEDTKDASFAGQYLTRLNVKKDDIIEAYTEVLASKYESRAIMYRLKKGFRDEDISMSVGCMAMVDAKISGVVYTVDPLDISSGYCIINATSGLAIKIVDGTSKPFVIKIKRDDFNDIKRYFSPDEFYIDDDTIKRIAETSLKIEEFFKSPQDIEWSIDTGNNLIILQSRSLSEKIKFSGVNKIQFLEDIKPIISGGISVNPGVSCGKILVLKEMIPKLKLPEKAVIVLRNPLPEFATIIPNSSAIISETGGIAGHLATVSREFGVPAIFGMENACDTLKDYREVTVDANNCAVYQGKIESLLSQEQKQKNTMVGSPVYLILKDILALTTPLNLTDPQSPYFKPSFCETLHDITRFCHEKAVTELSNFGRKFNFHQKLAKRLMVEGKTVSDWWVINLADGFKNEYDEVFQFINISDIVSLPMLALWEGISFEPWEGPPPIDPGGFGAILFGSTMNPSFQPELASSINAKNFFMISREYCNLSMRLGYHFAVVETLVTDIDDDNYISFNFRGGAADIRRKEMRVELIADILKIYDFRVDLKGDSLFARYDKEKKDLLLLRLKILGYILIHTRQIDMVMNNENIVKEYKNKISSGINRLIKKVNIH